MATFNSVTWLYLSLRCDLTLELFTRGLASEGADQHSQRFVAP
jgi:hypothetical protein